MTIDPNEYFSGAGGEVDEAAVLLRFFGDELDPDFITHRLGAAPTNSVRKGGIDPNRPWARPAAKGRWLLKRVRSRETLDQQINSLLDQLTPDISVWSDLADRYIAEIKCDLFMQRWCRATIVSRETMAAISARRLQLQLDIYTPHELWRLCR